MNNEIKLNENYNYLQNKKNFAKELARISKKI